MKIKNTIIGLFLLMMLCNGATALAGEAGGKITGAIISGNSQEPVAFANITLFNSANKLITGTLSDKNGKFEFEELNFDKYRLEISCLGYAKLEKEIDLSSESSVKKLGEIHLQPSAEKLGEVEISEERMKGEQEVDRTVFTINEEIQKTASDGMDVLKNIPGVSVDFQDNITLEGSGNIMYLVNGVKRNKNYVAQLNPKDFNKVEIITNPGVEYEADIDAVINIVTRSRQTGGRGSISLQGADPDNFLGNGNASLQYGNKNFRVFVSDRFHYENFPGSKLITNRIIQNSDTIITETKGNGRASWLNNSFSYGFDWFINDKNIINLYGEYYLHQTNNSNYLLHSIERYNSETGSEYDLNQSVLSDNKRLYNSLFYKHDFEDKEHYLSSQWNHYRYSSNANNHYDYQYTYINPEISPDLHHSRNEKIRNERQRLEWKNDYSRKLGKHRFGAGALSYYQWFDNNYELSSDSEKNFVYNEFRQEAYLSTKGGTKSIQYSGGVRMAYSKSLIEEDVTNTYTEWLPKISLQYNISKTSSLNLSARRRIYRPGLNQLNPFISTITDRVIQTGNPDLKPQVLNRTELKYTVNIKTSYLAPKLFLDYTTNSIQQDISFTDDGTAIMRPENVGQRYVYGLGLSGAIVIGKWFRMNPSLSLYQVEVAGPGGYQKKFVSYRINGHLILSPFTNKSFSFLANLEMKGPQPGYKSVSYRDPLVFAGINWQISKSFTASTFVAPLFGGFTYEETEHRDGDYHHLSSNRIDSSWLVALEIKYEFTWGKTPRRLQRSTDYERDGNGGTL
ncbi:MAG: TonB-dependent receptor domain-containing protein [Bacteroidales bacterium]